MRPAKWRMFVLSVTAGAIPLGLVASGEFVWGQGSYGAVTAEDVVAL